jgi:hypothetical protein
LTVGLLGFLLDLLVLLPLSLVRSIRPTTGSLISLSSLLFWFILELYSIGLVLELWGVFWLVIGILLAGVGAVPLAFLASLFRADWDHFFMVIALLVVAIGSSVVGTLLCGGPSDPRVSDEGIYGDWE